jgi:hypothetical protein
MTADAAFALERFAWEGPDRLTVSGWFSGLAPETIHAPVLVLRGEDRVRRLAAAPDGAAVPPADGARWSATFPWEEPPEAFHAATLELGSELAIPLPEPAPEQRAPGDEVLRVRVAGDDATSAGDRLRLQTELLAAEEQLEELRAALARATGDLQRSREDLLDERRRHAVDAERYRDGLAQVRAAADSAMAEVRESVEGERSRAEELARRLAKAHAPVAKARADTSLLLELLTSLERALDEPE